MSMPVMPPTPPPGQLTPRDVMRNWGPRTDRSPAETVLCTCCGHSARTHLNSTSCSARRRWWRRCLCTGYTGFDSVERP